MPEFSHLHSHPLPTYSQEITNQRNLVLPSKSILFQHLFPSKPYYRKHKALFSTSPTLEKTISDNRAPSELDYATKQVNILLNAISKCTHHLEFHLEKLLNLGRHRIHPCPCVHSQQLECGKSHPMSQGMFFRKQRLIWSLHDSRKLCDQPVHINSLMNRTTIDKIKYKPNLFWEVQDNLNDYSFQLFN